MHEDRHIVLAWRAGDLPGDVFVYLLDTYEEALEVSYICLAADDGWTTEIRRI